MNLTVNLKITKMSIKWKCTIEQTKSMKYSRYMGPRFKVSDDGWGRGI